MKTFWIACQAIATFALAVVALCTSVNSKLSTTQYGEDLKTVTEKMEAITNTITKNFEFTARPIVSIEMDDWKISHQKYKWKYEVPIYLRNYGPLPANKVTVKFNPKIWSESLKNWKRLDNPDRYSTSRVLFPGEIDSVKCLIRFSEKEIELAKLHENGIQINATVTYKGFTGSSPCSTEIDVTYDRMNYGRDTSYVNTKIW